MSQRPRQRSVLQGILSILIRHKPGNTPKQMRQLPTQPQRPPVHDHDAWRIYWHAQNQPWRTEPEIDTKRQQELARCRAIAPDIKESIYPFKGMKLSRADVEWLLATHEGGRGPINWNDPQQRGRRGLDLRGADLRNADLQRLPLACIHGGLTRVEEYDASEEQWTGAAVRMEGAQLREAHLEGADLSKAYLEGTLLRSVYLQEANLRNANLQRAHLPLAHLEGADLRKAHLVGAILFRAHLEAARLNEANLAGADLRSAFFDTASTLRDIISSEGEHGFMSVADVRWNDINLSIIDWSRVKKLGDDLRADQRRIEGGEVKLGDDLRADQRRIEGGEVKNEKVRLSEYEAAVRANRQLAAVLRAQGMNEQAAHFAYRAQVLQKRLLWFQMLQDRVKFRQRVRSLGAWLFSWFLFLLAGYGYKPERSFLAYLLVISGFATAYYLFGQMVGPSLSPLEAFVFSMTSFHGRGFFPGSNIQLDNPLTVLAAIEALVGLIIEVTFIATLTQRFFGR